MPKRKPMQVYVKPGTGVKAQQAVAAFNQMVGKKVMRITQNRQRADVVIRTGPAAKGHSASAQVGGAPQWNTRILVPKRSQEPGAAARYTLVHELGHAAGLNDKFRGNRPNLMSYPNPSYELSPRQKEKVRKNYRAQRKQFENP